MTHEEAIRKRVKTLKQFYMDVFTFILINSIIVLIWLIFDQTGTFWPKYLIVIWGIILIYKASRKGVLPLIFHRSSLFSHEWEERKVRELMRKQALHDRNTLEKEKNKKK
ncbi:MAG: 2TM domain-containing protein [Alphaproteobacteria bacterium]|nr:2TM domain-containing protein [Alphaproteobacteria bacterium]